MKKENEEIAKPNLSPEAFMQSVIGSETVIEDPKETKEPEELPGSKEPEDISTILPKKEEVVTKEEVEEEEQEPVEETVAEMLLKATGYEIDETLTDDIDGLIKGAEIIAEKMAQERIEEFLSSNEEIKKFVDFIQEGGDVSKYIKAASPDVRYDEIDITDQSAQKKLITDYLRKQDFDKDEIAEYVKDYEDSNVLEKQAKLAQKWLVSEQKKEKEAVIQEQKAIKAKQEEQAQQVWKNIETTLDKDNLAGIPLPKKEKDSFKKFLTETDKEGKSVRVQKYNQLNLEERLMLDYILYKGVGSLKSLVDNMATTKKVTDLKQILAKSKGTGTASGSFKEPESNNKKPDLSPGAFTRITN